VADVDPYGGAVVDSIQVQPHGAASV
jgi:hypothetical protein